MRQASRSRGLTLTLALVLGVALHGLAWRAAAQDAPPPPAGAAGDTAPATRAATLPGTVEALFRRANELAFAGNHAAALEVYGALGDVGIVDPDVEQNIAVCHARLGDLPRAIFHFERALLLRPGDEGVETALADYRHQMIVIQLM